MKDDSLSFAYFLGSRSLETGQYSSAFEYENQLWGGPEGAALTAADFEGCVLRVGECYGTESNGGRPLTKMENT